ncbi:hypothetical protein SHIRM173S_05803 [Streptomyces hirsutus]
MLAAVPGAPTWTTSLPMASRTGRIAYRSSAAPETNTRSSPLRAWSGLPTTQASTRRRPFSASRAAASRA